MPIKFPFGWGRTSAEGATTPAPATPYDPTHVWVSTPAGDVLVNTVTGQPAAPGTKISVPAGVSPGVLAASIPSVVSAPVSAIPTSIATPVAKESITMSLESAGKEVLSVLETVGKDVEKVLTVAVKYAVPVEALVSILFPAAGPAAAAAGTALSLIQTAVLEVEQKASALPAGLTAAQKAADILQLVGPAVTSILAQEKITAGSAEVANLISAVSAILNVAPVAA